MLAARSFFSTAFGQINLFDELRDEHSCLRIKQPAIERRQSLFHERLDGLDGAVVFSVINREPLAH